MKNILKISIVLLVYYNNGYSISLPQAIIEKKIKVTFENNGKYSGPSTQMVILNISKNNIEINSEPGIIIQSEDSTSQKLVISEPIVTKIIPGKSYAKIVNTFCINSYKASPQEKEQYTFLKEADTYLSRLVAFIHAKKTNISDSQSAVWACMNGKKDIYLSDKKIPDLIDLQKMVTQLYKEKLALGLIVKDTSPVNIAYQNFQIQGSYDFFVKQEGIYSAHFEDSTGNKLFSFFENRKLTNGLYPIRYMNAYADKSEKAFYISIYKNGSLLEKIKAKNETNPKRYERFSYKSSTIFNIKEPFLANLNLTDSLDNVYVTYFTNKKMYHGLIPFDYSFTISKPRNTKLYLVLTDNSGKVYNKQLITSSSKLMALKGYCYVRIQQSTDAVFGLYSADDQLIEEFENKRYSKGLEMLPYGFMFDKSSEEAIYLKLKDKNTGKDIYSEKVFVK